MHSDEDTVKANVSSLLRTSPPDRQSAPRYFSKDGRPNWPALIIAAEHARSELSVQAVDILLGEALEKCAWASDLQNIHSVGVNVVFTVVQPATTRLEFGKNV